MQTSKIRILTQVEVAGVAQLARTATPGLAVLVS